MLVKKSEKANITNPNLFIFASIILELLAPIDRPASHKKQTLFTTWAPQLLVHVINYQCEKGLCLISAMNKLHINGDLN